ncbi:MAG: VOC family protein [Xanthobacteraceae bacterium]
MLEHVGIPVASFAKSKKFYVAALKPLEYKLTGDYSPEAAGFFEGGHTSFWISKEKGGGGIHVAFLAKSRRAVQGFYAAALKAGGKDNGEPGRREGYGYAAFVYDPDGNNIEAVLFEKGDK